MATDMNNNEAGNNINIFGGFMCPSCDGRVVKALDLKSNGIFPRRFEPCSQRYFFFFFSFFFFLLLFVLLLSFLCFPFFSSTFFPNKCYTQCTSKKISATKHRSGGCVQKSSSHRLFTESKP